MLPLFTKYLEEISDEGGVADSTIETRERELKRFSEWLENCGVDAVEEIEKNDIDGYTDHLIEQGYARNTLLKSKYSAISAAFSKLYELEKIHTNPISRVKRKTIKKKYRNSLTPREKKNQDDSIDYLKKSEVYELAENAPEPKDRNELLIKFMFWTGVRVSELVLIDIGKDGTLTGEESDIDPSKPTVDIYSTKVDENRPVSYPKEEINPLLRDWVNHGRIRYKAADDSRQLFIGRKGPLTNSGVERVIDEAAKNMGIQEIDQTAADGREYKRVTPHLLRHSHGMYYHNKRDVNLGKIKDHLGHSSTDITQEFYAESDEEAIIETFGN